MYEGAQQSDSARFDIFRFCFYCILFLEYCSFFLVLIRKVKYLSQNEM